MEAERTMPSRIQNKDILLRVALYQGRYSVRLCQPNYVAQRSILLKKCQYHAEIISNKSRIPDV